MERELTQPFFGSNDSPLSSRKESRKRGLQFNLPAIIPFSGNVRVIENDDSITSLQDVYEQHCRSIGISREDPVLAFTERIQALYKQTPTPDVRTIPSHLLIGTRLTISTTQRSTLATGRQEIYEEISNKMVPDTVLQKVNILDPCVPILSETDHSLLHTVFDSNDVVTERSLALQETNDHVDGFFHLLVLCPVDVG